LQKFKASCDLGFKFTGQKKTYSCDGKILYEAPDRLYLRGYRSLLGTFFVMKTDGRTFSVNVPRKKKVYTGTEDEGLATGQLEEAPSAIEKLKPAHILEALLLGPLNLKDPSRKIAFGILPGEYIIHVLRMKEESLVPERTIWVERKTLRVSRHETYGDDGTLQGRATFTGTIDVDGFYLPKEVLIQRFWEGIEIRIALSKVKTDIEVNEKAFRPDSQEKTEPGREEHP
jgi:hypothetical protein